VSAFRTIEISDPRFERDDLRHVTVKSASLRRRADAVVHATPAARQRSNVPLVILLHGVYGSSWSWALQGGAHATNARLQASGEIPPLVLAMPSDGLWGDGSGYLKHPAGDFERWIVDEVPLAARGAVPSIGDSSPLCIAGLSMGGFGALRLAAKYPDRFLAASGHSSITRLDQMAQFVDEPIDAYETQPDEGSVLETMIRARRPLPALRFDCGTSDLLLDENRTLASALAAAGIPHTYQEFPGGHDWAYWETHLADTLKFFGALLPTRR
jgi:putative tributyrin esterase